MIELKNSARRVGRVLKRIFDLVGALIGCMLLSPIMILTAIAIKLESKGPIIYKNERVSKDGNFYTYKFRSMYSQHCTGNGYGETRHKNLRKTYLQHNKTKGPLYRCKTTRAKRELDALLTCAALTNFHNFSISSRGDEHWGHAHISHEGWKI